MRPLVVIEVPGLSRSMTERYAPALSGLGYLGSVEPVIPALTLPAHASLLTGLRPDQHGVVANGWYFRDHNEVMMWRQGEGLVQGEKVWETGKKRDPSFTCLKHFWWPGMGSTADIYTNVRPAYFADGRKSGDVYANKPGLAKELQQHFGPFPLFKFWGPGVGLEASRWIAESAAYLYETFTPTLSLIYLPHLDYRQQTLGPDHPSIADEVRALDQVAEDLIRKVRALGAEVMVLSSYTMQAVSRPVHLNRILRREGLLQVMCNPTGELIDFGASRAFAVSDHQCAQVYVRAEEDREPLRRLLEELPGVQSVEPGTHPHQGDWVVWAEPDAWFTYYYWLEDSNAPDFARTVAIHAKPGYDPCEMLLDPALSFPRLKVAGKVLRKKLGMRMVMDVIPLDANLIRGSHGLQPQTVENQPVYTCTQPPEREGIALTDVKDEMLRLIFE